MKVTQIVSAQLKIIISKTCYEILKAKNKLLQHYPKLYINNIQLKESVEDKYLYQIGQWLNMEIAYCSEL